jgi:hypothetical protein
LIYIFFIFKETIGGKALYTRNAVILVVAATAAILGVGCGSGDSTAGGPSEDTSGSAATSSFVKEANAICVKERESSFERVGVAAKRYRSQGVPEPTLMNKAARKGTLATIEAETAGIRSLKPPPEEQKEVEAVLVALQSALDEAREGKKVSGKDIITPTDEVIALFAKADKELRAYGLTRCTKG